MMHTIDFTKEKICVMVISSLDNNNKNALLTMRIGFKKKLDYLNDAPNSSILNEKLVKENEILKAQVLDVNPILTKLTKKKENADQLRSNQICMFKKSDLR
ncbi:hypothetical protein NC652_038435 [Populus alba x Populus x berolinensis]|nr:hypothetical protein NC652_038435 [Populus alba x Populus x berolinensis]